MGAFSIIGEIVRYGVVGWLALLALSIAYRCLTGGIHMDGLLARSEIHAAEGLPSPERVQLLFAFAIAVAAYVRLMLNAMHGGSVTKLPDAPVELITLFAASHTIYLGGKLGWMLNLKRFLWGGQS